MRDILKPLHRDYMASFDGHLCECQLPFANASVCRPGSGERGWLSNGTHESAITPLLQLQPRLMWWNMRLMKFA
jgi:hypothetical protein